MNCAHRDCPHPLVAGAIYCNGHLAVAHRHRGEGNWPPGHPAWPYLDDKGLGIARENGVRAAEWGRPRVPPYDGAAVLVPFNRAWFEGYDAARKDAA